MSTPGGAEFFSEVPLTDELAGYSVDQQSYALSALTFSNFLRHPRVRAFLDALDRVPRMPTVRYMYLHFLFRRISEFIGDVSFVEASAALMPKDADLGDMNTVYAAFDAAGPDALARLGLVLEAMTRGQHFNTLWDVLRDGIISASKFSRAIKQQGSAKIFSPWPIQNNYYVASPLAFGLRCESTVREVLCRLICRNKRSVTRCGFLQSPLDGIFGVSLDLCLNAHTEDGAKGAPGHITFGSDAEIYEIKSRFKYLFAKTDCDSIYPAYRELYERPGKEALVAFLHAIPRPAVEFVPDGRLPTEADYLITADNDWNVRHAQRHRKLTTPTHNLVARCIARNSRRASTAYLLSDPSLNGGKIDIKAQFRVDVFVNPRHAYYSQVLLQYKVVKSYISLQPGPPGLGSPGCFIVSAFFRQRAPDDPALCTIGDSGGAAEEAANELGPGTEIPVLLIITPVVFPPDTIADSLSRASNFWTRCAEEAFPHAPWVPDSVVAAAGGCSP
ncbi:Alkaline exonuclease [Eptesicus fuscus gammaherpesvirus]|uniref:Alkaline exonuclease n=1 Tax=vespertilionid gammaherpesvirus 3 TaxID=2846598 RepID=A0A2D0ZPJ4_9GAMA|nr:Alkaline exonuclease [Eptesicus fuscus gammaherpesvirus]ATA58266.1 Alkaline exonuclease [Eptesicus fuscus gammaherpesvirus]WAH70904.1 shutoff alkaline exonuclease [Eptesicus fuscus gammaherpesvirus]